ncbi:hypothetical protein ABIC28_005094 [Rhodococcus sp. PvR044]|uniref:hypothetical protein n=1 Tax=Rhodococcus sp. PvR044 TaxID=3156402 RepID=UPI00339A9B17
MTRHDSMRTTDPESTEKPRQVIRPATQVVSDLTSINPGGESAPRILDEVWHRREPDHLDLAASARRSREFWILPVASPGLVGKVNALTRLGRQQVHNLPDLD